MNKQHIAFLYLKTGGGHLSAANALASRISERFSRSAKVWTFNPIPERRLFSKFLLQEGYRISSMKIEKFWIFIYEFNKLRFMQLLWTFIMTNIIRRNLKSFIRENNITKIVVLHFLLITPVFRILTSLKEEIPQMTIVTDPFTAHEFWFNQPHIPKIVFSSQVKNYAIESCQVNPDKIFIFPIILKSQFGAPLSPEEREKKKQEFGFHPDKKLILFAGGGEGYPRGDFFVRALLKSEIDLELAVVCGHDDLLKKTIEMIAGHHKNKIVKVFGFIDFMFELMNMADVIVSKGGPATIMEALILKKPLIITQYIYGQEKGNVEFVVNKGVGFYVDKPKAMVRTLRELLKTPETYQQVIDKISSITIQNGTDPIIEFIINYPVRNGRKNPG